MTSLQITNQDNCDSQDPYGSCGNPVSAIPEPSNSIHVRSKATRIRTFRALIECKESGLACVATRREQSQQEKAIARQVFVIVLWCRGGLDGYFQSVGSTFDREAECYRALTSPVHRRQFPSEPPKVNI